MLTSAISGIDGVGSAPLNSTWMGSATAATSPAATHAPNAAAATGAGKPFLIIPTKPPLSAAIMAELMGRPVLTFGYPAGTTTGGQSPVNDVPNGQAG